jgi:hypothetical protein
MSSRHPSISSTHSYLTNHSDKNSSTTPPVQHSIPHQTTVQYILLQLSPPNPANTPFQHFSYHPITSSPDYPGYLEHFPFLVFYLPKNKLNRLAARPGTLWASSQMMHIVKQSTFCPSTTRIEIIYLTY